MPLPERPQSLLLLWIWTIGGRRDGASCPGTCCCTSQGDFCPLPHGAGGGGRLDSAVTERDARPHLMESHKGMQSPAFNSRRTNTGRMVLLGDHMEMV